MRWLDAAGSTVIRIKGALWTDDNVRLRSLCQFSAYTACS